MKSVRLMLMIMAVTGAVACGKNTGSLQSSGVPGAGPVGANVDIRECQVGQVYSEQFGCLSNNNQCAGTQGYSEQARTCVDGRLITENMVFGTENGAAYFSRLTVTNPTQFAQFLKNSLKCERFGNLSFGFAGGGGFNCMNYAQTGFVFLKVFDAERANVIIGAGIDWPQDLMNRYTFGSSMWAQPIIPYNTNFQTRISQRMKPYFDFNAGNGTELVAQPDNVALTIQIDNGHIGLPKVNARVIYNGVEMGLAELQRYELKR